MEPLKRHELLDFEKILKITLQYAAQKYPSMQYVGLHTVYRRFDATRGMDYRVHLNMREPRLGGITKSRELIKSFELVKPLGRVEVVPSPYVTESTRIALLVPTMEHKIDDAINFITQYERICMRNQDNTFLLMVSI